MESHIYNFQTDVIHLLIHNRKKILGTLID